MKETSFIEKNKHKWHRFEQVNASQQSDPEEIGDLFTEINDDLSYAQTFYQRRTVRAYLNQLAQGVHSGLYKQKKQKITRFWSLWKTTLPIEIYNSRKNLLFALIVFVAWVAVGVVASSFNPDFAYSILGGGYMGMTIENIESNNPMGVYESQNMLTMFLDITLNNIGVAFKCFAAGITFTVGTHLLMFSNGMMLGAFQYWFKLKGLLLTSFLAIWIHGAFEISAIIIASGAGITLGNGLIFPGSYTRMQSLQISARRGIRIMLSLVPVFIIAGFLESFVTRNYQVLPNWSKWMIIGFSFALIIFYYVIYPIVVARKHPELVHTENVPNHVPKKKINLHKIRKSGTVIRETYYIYRHNFKKIWKVTINVAMPIMILLILIQDYKHYDVLTKLFEYDWEAQMSVMFANIYGPYFETLDIIITVLWIIPITIIASSVFYTLKTLDDEFQWASYWAYFKSNFAKILLGMSFPFLAFTFLPFYLLIPFLFLLPFFFLIPASMGLSEGKNKMGRGFKFSASHWGHIFFLLILLFVIIRILTYFVAGPVFPNFGFSNGMGAYYTPDLLDLLVEKVEYFSSSVSDNGLIYGNITRQIIYLLTFCFILPIILIASGLSYFSAQEEVDAVGLKEEFKKFGKRSRKQETDIDFE